MNKSKQSTKKTITVMIIVLIVIAVSYYFIRTSTKPLINIGADNDSEVEKILSKDLDNNYPSSPREVVKLYSRISKCLYNENLSEKEIDKLAKVIRVLLDEELLENNPNDVYLIDLKTDITTFRKAKRTIVNHSLQNNEDIIYWDNKEESMASIVSSISLKEDSEYAKIYHKYILKKDMDGNWKILGWGSTDEIDITGSD